MPVRARKAIGFLGIVLFLIAYIVVVVELAAHLPARPGLIHAGYYLIAGVAWALPLRPALRWMSAPDPSADGQG